MGGHCWSSGRLLQCLPLRRRNWYGKGVSDRDLLLSLIIAVVASVISHLICKWLDSDKQSVTSLWFKLPCQKGIENPSAVTPGFLLVVRIGLLASFCLMALQHMQDRGEICFSNLFIAPAARCFSHIDSFFQSYLIGIIHTTAILFMISFGGIINPNHSTIFCV